MATENHKTRVIILTASYRITGDIHLVSGSRVTDYFQDSRDFIAVTNADVWEIGGRKVFSAQFVNISRDHIQVVTPED